MKILGIDPGYESMGYAICEKGIGHSKDKKKQSSLTSSLPTTVRLLEAGTLKSPSGSLFSKRLAKLCEDLEMLLRRFAIEEAAIERVFFTAVWKSAVKVAEARGVVLAVLARANVTSFEYSPTEIKRAITGNGRCGKQAVMDMIIKICDIKQPIKTEDNAMDAVAIALTHYFHTCHYDDRISKHFLRERET
ncbi:crossover junction endodeoxyribonuclease RuvC [Spirochaetota bacterium]|nr:crossover junction endodeoxyribonuclease RuvC [Spirochaetota bacterium]